MLRGEANYKWHNWLEGGGGDGHVYLFFLKFVKKM